MTDAPTCPGVTEYLYHAACPASVYRDGTWIAPSAFTPRCSRYEVTPMAGMRTETGAERRSDSGWARPNPTEPAAPADGWGACCWRMNVTATATPPKKMSSAPARPAMPGRRPPRRGAGGG